MSVALGGRWLTGSPAIVPCGALGRLHCSGNLSRQVPWVRVNLNARTNSCSEQQYKRYSSQALKQSPSTSQIRRQAKHYRAVARASVSRRYCSSEASSSVVRMASDRDILSDE